MKKNNYCLLNIPKDTSKKENLPKKLKQYLIDLNNADEYNEDKEYKNKCETYWKILFKLNSIKDKTIFHTPELAQYIDELITRLSKDIKKTKMMKKEVDGYAYVFIYCWYILIYIDSIKPIENQLILEYLKPIFGKMKKGPYLLFYGIHKMKSIKNLANIVDIITKQILYYISFELLTSNNKIKFEVNTLYSFIKNEKLVNRHYYEFILNVCFLNLIGIKEKSVNPLSLAVLSY